MHRQPIQSPPSPPRDPSGGAAGERPDRPEPSGSGSITRLASASYLAVGLGLITSPILARALGPTARGEYAAVYTYVTALEILLSLGIPVAITYHLINRLEQRQRLLGSAVRFCAALCIPSAGIAVALALGVMQLPAGTATYLAIAALALAPAGTLGLCLGGFLTASGSLDSLAWLRLAPLAANCVGVVVLALVGALTLVSYLALTLAISALSLALAFGFVGLRPRGRVPFRSLIGFGLRSYPGSFARLLNVRVDQLILVPLVSPAQLGFYAIAVTISQLPQNLADAIGARALGTVIGAERLFLAHRAERYVRLTMLVSTIACAGIAALAPFAVPLLYGQAFDGIVVPLLLLLPGGIANAGTRVVGPCLTAVGRPGVTSTAEITALAITAAGLWYALPRYGISGAAAVSSLAYGYRFCAQAIVLRRYGVRRTMPGGADLAELVGAIPRPWSRR